MHLVPILAAALLAGPPAPARIAKTPAPVKGAPVKAAAAPAAQKNNGLRSELLTDLDDVEKKLLQLAMAMPAGQYSWRPARGIRSVSEVYMHIAGANYVAATAISGTKASGNEPVEQGADKERVIDELRKSFDQLRLALTAVPDGDFDRQVKMYGDLSTIRATFITVLGHAHEHLGQSIAYARMNGIAPPWSGM